MQGNPNYIPLFDTYIQFVGVSIGVSGNVPYVRAYDTFTDTDGTLLNAHTMNMGPGWVLTAATYTIQSNKASSSTSSSRATVSVGVTDVTITGSVSATGPGGAGFVFRYVDESNYGIARIRPPVDFEITERIGGVESVRAGGTSTFTDGVAYDCTLIVNGTSVTFTITGKGTINYTLLSLVAGTRHGLYTNGNSVTATWDDFQLVG